MDFNQIMWKDKTCARIEVTNLNHVSSIQITVRDNAQCTPKHFPKIPKFHSGEFPLYRTTALGQWPNVCV